ncbi:MAG: hypothetical protein AB1641_23435 [Thermodesulfobacteriota bacterium]
MKDFYRNNRKLLLVLGFILLAAAIVWAAAELSGQANSMAQDAGSSSADMEMTTLNTVKKPAKTKDSPQPPPCDWAKERQIKSQLDANDAKYKALRDRAKSEMKSAGKVAPGTKDAVMASAREFKGLCDQYAAMWDACKCYTRGKTARKSGESRMSSAEVLVSEIDEGKLSKMQAAQDAMKTARREYASEAAAGGEISDADKADLKSTVVPQIQTLTGQVQTLVTGVTQLLGDIQKGATGGGLSSITSMAKTAASGGGASDIASKLLKPVTTLLSVAKGMLANVQALMSDAQTLITGSPSAAGAVAGAGAKKMGPCFVGAAEE